MDDPQIFQNSQSVKLNKCVAQRRYRKKEGQSFSQLREALREVSQDDPRSKQEILKRASRELRRLADENILLLQQKALMEARTNGRYGMGYPERITDENASLGMQWWLHDTTTMGDITRSDVARHRVLAGAVPPDMNTFTTSAGPEHRQDQLHLWPGAQY